MFIFEINMCTLCELSDSATKRYWCRTERIW